MRDKRWLVSGKRVQLGSGAAAYGVDRHRRSGVQRRAIGSRLLQAAAEDLASSGRLGGRLALLELYYRWETQLCRGCGFPSSTQVLYCIVTSCSSAPSGPSRHCRRVLLAASVDAVAREQRHRLRHHRLALRRLQLAASTTCWSLLARRQRRGRSGPLGADACSWVW